MLRGSDVEENLNMRGAYLHVISDMLGSIGAVIAALLIIFLDGVGGSLASVIVAILVLRSGFYVTKSSLHVLMEGAPSNINTKDIIKTIKNSKKLKIFMTFMFGQ